MCTSHPVSNDTLRTSRIKHCEAVGSDDLGGSPTHPASSVLVVYGHAGSLPLGRPIDTLDYVAFGPEQLEDREFGLSAPYLAPRATLNSMPVSLKDSRA